MKKLFAVTLTIFISLSALGSPQSGKYFDRAIFVVFENTNYAIASKQPFFKQLSDAGAHFSNFMALIHPSQGNYIALTSGAINGVTSDGTFNVNANNIVDLLEAKGITWKVYAEDYPGNCFTGKSKGNYVRKHNPFISYVNIQNNPARCANIVNSNEFDRDAMTGSLPSYVFYIPNMKNDGHDTGVTFADAWYRQRFTPFLNNPQFMANTILVSTFDESALSSSKNQIYTTIVGPNVKPLVAANPLTIYSLLRLVEDNWGLSSLGKEDAKAALIPNIWIH